MNSSLYNSRAKFRINEFGALVPYELVSFNRPLFGARRQRLDSSVDLPVDRDYSDDSRRRAIRSVRDYGMCNPDLSIFVTLTLDGRYVDRYSYPDVISKLNVWLDNKVRRHGLKYIVVPEYHKDRAIHFHGLLNDVLPLSPTEILWHDKPVFNLPAWSLGFTTAQRIDGEDCIAKVTNYVLKYITKSDDKIGGRYYLHGGALNKPVIGYFDIPQNDVAAIAYEIAPGVTVATSRDELTISGLTTAAVRKEVDFRLEK